MGRLAKTLARVEAAGLADAELLRRFRASRDEAAFGAILRRHQGLVWAVCVSELGHRQDAEDAFQATFLSLARDAAGVRAGDSLAGWLGRVAGRCARRAARRRRRRSEVQAAVPEPAAEDRDPTADLRAVLERELAALPAEYRRAVVLCDGEGRTYREAAAALGCPLGTLASWLRFGRAELRRRLAERGVVPAGLVSLTLANAAGAAACPAGVRSLCEGAFIAMLSQNWKWVAAAALAVSAAGVTAWGPAEAQPPAAGKPKDRGPTLTLRLMSEVELAKSRLDKAAKEVELAKAQLMQAEAGMAAAEAGLAAVRARVGGKAPAPKAPGQPQVEIVTLRNADVAAVVEALGQHFLGRGDGLQMTVYPPGNALILQGPEAILAQIVAVAERLDKLPQTPDLGK